ncbi:MAG: ATP synthase F1 subunit gamma [Phycisphaerales bacterium]|nr:ATP synthase F1 subunit gamma [Phycisphaerales bacterium]
MAKARAIVKRRNAVRNIRKITQTMQLIATARFAKTLQRATASKPYTEKLTEMISTLSAAGTIDHPLLKPNAGVDKSILLVMTSNRGLCGAFNSSVLRLALEHKRRLEQERKATSIEMVGKKGVAYLRFLRMDVASAITDIEDKIAYARVAEIADRFMQLYETRQIARVDVAYMRFISAGSQKAIVTQLLPIEPPKSDAAAASKKKIDFEFSPAPEVLLAKLIPEMVKIRLYQIFNEAIVSEQIARMVAMKSATDSAGDMIKYLTRQYNRARQGQITTELADIVGGAEAVK